MLEAVDRQVTALGIFKADSLEFNSVIEAMNPKNDLGVSYHTIMNVFVIKVPDYVDAEPDDESLAVKWFREIDPKWPNTCREVLARSGLGKSRK